MLDLMDEFEATEESDFFDNAKEEEDDFNSRDFSITNIDGREFSNNPIVELMFIGSALEDMIDNAAESQKLVNEESMLREKIITSEKSKKIPLKNNTDTNLRYFEQYVQKTLKT